MQLTPFSLEIIEEAYHLAHLQKTSITIVTAISNDAGMANGEGEAKMNNELCNKARVAISSLNSISVKSDIAVGINVEVGSPAAVIENCAQNYNADLLVMGARKKKTFHHYMRNNNGSRILAAIKCNTYIVHEGKGIINKKPSQQLCAPDQQC
jgi:nucleotide-binding universal stress UspA family protein